MLQSIQRRGQYSVTTLTFSHGNNKVALLECQPMTLTLTVPSGVGHMCRHWTLLLVFLNVFNSIFKIILPKTCIYLFFITKDMHLSFIYISGCLPVKHVQKLVCFKKEIIIKMLSLGKTVNINFSKSWLSQTAYISHDYNQCYTILYYFLVLM